MAREVGDGAAAVSAVPGTDPWIGRVIAGRYRVVDFLAAGGMGRIYRAEQEPLGRLVVLKVLNPRYTASGDDPEFQKRFLLEAATCAKLHHPNVVTIYDYGKVDNDDTYYMAMELVVGRTLGQVLRAEGPMPAARVIRIARQIGRALREAHHLGIVHRDLKPSNVMLVHTDEGESVKVLDFGLVKVLRDDSEELTMEGKFLGSPKYMSPEQIRHQEVDARSDLYSLGVIMFELLTGKVPFEGTQAVQTLMMHVSLPAPSLRERGAAVPLELDGVVQRCLMKEPEQRFADVDEFMTGLRIAAAALGDDAASFDPLRSTSGFGLSSSSGVLAAPGRDSLAGSTGSGKAISSPHRTSISDSFPSGSGVTAPRPAEIPRSAPPPVPTSSSGNLRAPLIVGAAIVVAAAVLGLVLSRGWSSDPSSGRGEPHASADDRPRPEPAERPTDPPATSPSQTGSPSLPTPPAPAPHAVAPPATPPVEVTLQLGSVPEADVYEGDARLGSTPVTLPLSPSATTPRTFVLRRAGFRDEEVVVAPTTSSIRREVRLRRETVTSKSTRPSRPSAPAPPASPAPERPRHNPDLDIRTSR